MIEPIHSATWEASNLTHLGCCIEAVRADLSSTDPASGDSEDPTAAWARAERVAERMQPQPAVETLRSYLGLSPFELSLVLLCVAWELERPTFEPLLHEQHPTFGLAMSRLPLPHWSACTPESALRRFCLVRYSEAAPLLTAPLRIDEQVLHFLKGAGDLAPELRRASTELIASGPLTAGHRSAMDELTVLFGQQGRDWSAVNLVGSRGDCREAAGALAEAMNLTARVFSAGVLPRVGTELESFGRLLERETRLGLTLPLIETGQEAASADDSPSGWLAQHFRGPILFASEEPLDLAPGAPRIRVSGATADERRWAWRHLLRGRVDLSPSQVDRLVSQFRLDSITMRTVADAMPAMEAEAPDDSGFRWLWRKCADLTAPRLDGLAQRLEPRRGGELVLPPRQHEVLHAVVEHARHRGTVDLSWGMSEGRGTGITVLFAGPSGTGKTMAAETIAGELELPLFRIDLSSVVSKYIGETEKHLRKLFDAAEGGGAILLFDEADSLFGKRTEVSSSHDRHANIEVGYLLQRLESYSGLAILTSNHRDHLDPAFLRRLRFVVNFPEPGRRQREDMWRRAFTEEVPVGELDFHRLSEIELTGGNIRNASLVAASLAAGSTGQVDMPHVLEAARLELVKQRKPLPSL